MEFSAILSAAYDECNYASSPASAVVTRMKRFVNEGVRAILAEPGLGRLSDSDSPYTFASVASTARYVVPEAVARILHISERTNDYALTAMDLATYRRIDPDAVSNTGTPTHYVPMGRVAVAAQPSDASQLFVKSTAAGDTGSAFLEGLRTAAIYSETITMTGVTAAGSAAGTITEVTDFYLSAAAAGTITLHEDSGSGTELARINTGQKRPRYYGFYLWPTPAAAVTYYVDYRREVEDMANNTDEPPLPTDIHPILVAYAVAREMEKADHPERLAIAQNRYARLLSKLKYQTQTLSDEIPVLGRGALVGRSRLGPMYPADYYSR